MTPDERDEIEALARQVADSRPDRCGAPLNLYAQPVRCEREAGHPGNRHETSGVSWVTG